MKAASILSDVTTACQPQTAAHNLTLETDIDPALTVRADPHFIGQVFRNLIENACRYAPEGSTIKVSGGKRLDHNGLPEALFMICDDGPGIPQADIARVFERFYRVEKHRSSPASTGSALPSASTSSSATAADLGGTRPGGCLQFTLPLAAETGKKDVRGTSSRRGPHPKSTMPSRRLRPPKNVRKDAREPSGLKRDTALFD